jgi:hypothetical protein
VKAAQGPARGYFVFHPFDRPYKTCETPFIRPVEVWMMTLSEKRRVIAGRVTSEKSVDTSILIFLIMASVQAQN